MKTDLEVLAAKYVLGELDPDELREIAVEAVCDGIDGRSMVFLAGATAADAYDDLRELFGAALREQGIALPSRLEAATRLIRHVASEVAEGRLAPRDGAWEIVALFQSVEQLVRTVRYVGDALGVEHVYGLYYSYEDFGSAGKWAEIDAQIVAACVTLARR